MPPRTANEPRMNLTVPQAMSGHRSPSDCTRASTVGAAVLEGPSRDLRISDRTSKKKAA